MSTDPATPTLPLKLPDGTDLPPRPTELWREHTGTRLAEHHPEAHAEALEMMRDGDTLTEIAEHIGPKIGKTSPGEIDGLRKILRGWRRRAGIDPTDIARELAADARHEAAASLIRNIKNAKTRDIGPVAMALTQAHNVERSLGGLPSEIKVSTKLTLADLERLASATPPAQPPIRDVIDITEQPTD